jgi:hypothetical protein
MRIAITRNWGMLLLALWLILMGLSTFGLSLPGPIMGLIVLAAGVLILLGR